MKHHINDMKRRALHNADAAYYVLDYLAHSFPVQLYEPFTDSEGNLSSRPVVRDGQPAECREAARRRDALIERLAGLPPVPGALDQIIQRFGTDLVAEVTGRSRRIVRKGEGTAARLVVESRAGSANLAETAAFMYDQKRILIFSDAGGTGRSYHADLGAKNQRLRVHYLLEPGWKADAAIQGLGRTNRTNQAQPPLFRPVATDVKAEKRFLSTIARRLDTLGAITRGQRQTGGQGLFRPEDNLESPYARDALRQLYRRLYRGDVAGCSLGAFEDATGLSLTDDNGLKDDLPPITTFLNRLLALTIHLQAVLFSAFEELLDQRIEGAIAAGVYDLGLETLRAESFRVTDARVIYTHPGSGAETQLLTIAEKRRNTPTSLSDALDWLDDPKARLLVNSRSGRAAAQVPATSLMLDDGTIEPRLRLIRPTEASTVPARMMEDTHWLEADRAAFTAAWTAELAEVPEFTETTLHIVAGLLLPIWKQLPQDETRVYRLQTDDGQRIIGRRVSPAWVATTLADDAPKLSAAQVHAIVLEGKTVMRLAEGMELHRSRVMGVNRIELSGFTEAAKDRLKADGFFSEIISWKLRLFCPTDSSGIAVLDRLVARCPVTALHARGGCRVMYSETEDVIRALAENAESVCRAYLPAGRREGSYWIVGDLQNNPGRSLFVRLTGPASGPGAAGKFADGATGEHGDLLDIIRERTGISRFPDLLAEARAHLGRPQPVLPDAPEPTKAKAPGGTPAAAARLFAASVPVATTLAETYLRSRGITQGGTMSALRFHPKCWHRDEGQTRSIPRPALIAAVTDGAGALQGVHRTWLAPDGRGKALVETRRRAMGHLLGNAVQLTPHDDILVVGEGIETMLSLVEAVPGLPVWAALSSSHLGAVLLPEGLQRLYIAIDRDPAGQRAAERLSARATEVGVSVRMLEPRLGDFNDDLRANGKGALRQHLAGQIGPEDRQHLLG